MQPRQDSTPDHCKQPDQAPSRPETGQPCAVRRCNKAAPLAVSWRGKAVLTARAEGLVHVALEVVQRCGGEPRARCRIRLRRDGSRIDVSGSALIRHAEGCHEAPVLALGERPSDRGDGFRALERFRSDSHALCRSSGRCACEQESAHEPQADWSPCRSREWRVGGCSCSVGSRPELDERLCALAIGLGSGRLGAGSRSPEAKGVAMKATRAVMGGGRRFFHPRYVWSPAGGYWNDGSAAAAGRKWLLFGGAGMLIFAVSRYSSSHEVSSCRGAIAWHCPVATSGRRRADAGTRWPGRGLPSASSPATGRPAASGARLRAPLAARHRRRTPFHPNP